MRDFILRPTVMTTDLGIMFWLNGGQGGTITESLTIIIGVDIFTYVLYPYDVQEKEEG